MANLNFFFDTNYLFDENGKSFFKNGLTLKKLEKIGDILIPETVEMELRAKYLREFNELKERFESKFKFLSNFCGVGIHDFNGEEKVNEMYTLQRGKLNFSIIKLKDTNVLNNILLLAINKLPPFENKSDTDKGFKDACIYFTVLEYMENNNGEYYFFTDDNNLKEKINENKFIKICTSIEDVNVYLLNKYKDPYYIGRIKEETSLHIESEDVLEVWSASGKDFIFLDDFLNTVIEFDSGEILSYTEYLSFADNIKLLIESKDWGNTHKVCKELIPIAKYIRPKDVKELFQALLNNDQIYGTYGYGVQKFYNELFQMHYLLLDLNDIKELEEKFKLNVSGANNEIL